MHVSNFIDLNCSSLLVRISKLSLVQISYSPVGPNFTGIHDTLMKEELHFKLKLSIFCALSQNYQHFSQKCH